MKNKIIEVRRKNALVKIYTTQESKKGEVYVSYKVADHSQGDRKLWRFADLEKAKAKANEIADAINAGETEVLKWEQGLRLELRKALEAIQPTGLSIYPAASLFAQAVKILGSSTDLLSACQYWRDHRPQKPITAKAVSACKDDYLARQTRISKRRFRTVKSYLTSFAREFQTKNLHEVEVLELKDYVDKQDWSPKTRNEFLGAVGLLFKEAAIRNWVPANYNPAREVPREKLNGSTIDIFEPWEARQILSRLDPELIPFLSLWFFAGIRKEEISRLTWPQVNRGLRTGWIYLEASETKTGQPRSVPVEPNLKLWLAKYGKEIGKVLPPKWQGMQQLDELTRYIARKTRVVWKDNGPRHSYATYAFKKCKDAGAVVSAMGTSLAKFEKHYWHKGQTVNEESAAEWFSISPDTSENVIPLVVNG